MILSFIYYVNIIISVGYFHSYSFHLKGILYIHPKIKRTPLTF
jgi:hypothetical protein